MDEGLGMGSSGRGVIVGLPFCLQAEIGTPAGLHNDSSYACHFAYPEPLRNVIIYHIVL